MNKTKTVKVLDLIVIMLLVAVCCGILGGILVKSHDNAILSEIREERDKAIEEATLVRKKNGETLFKTAEFWLSAVRSGHDPESRFGFPNFFLMSISDAEAAGVEKLKLLRLVEETEAVIRSGRPKSYPAEVRDTPWFGDQIRALKDLCK